MAAASNGRDIVVIGASAGGVEALQKLLAALPREFPATVFIVQHLSHDAPSMLPALLTRRGPLAARTATDGAAFRHGEIWIAPPDHHLIVERERMRISHGPRENRHRPSIDVLFRSAAVAFGPRVVSVVLTGLLDDGTAGTWAVKARGGVVMVQDPDDALYPDMPRSVLEAVSVDFRLPLADIAEQLRKLVNEVVVPAQAPATDRVEAEMSVADPNADHAGQLDQLGARSSLTCPDCGGALWELAEPQPRFRCHVGHAYSMRSMIAAQVDRVEAALWAGVRGLEESRSLARRLGEGARHRGHARSASYYEERAHEDERHADVLRGILRELPAAERAEADTAATPDTSAT